MGEPKAFLRLEGRTFLERAVTALRDGGCGEVVVVVAGDEYDTPRAIGEAAMAMGAKVALNPVAGSEQADSLRHGLRALGDDAEAAVVLPVDVPGVDAKTVRAVADAFRRTAAPVVQPSHGARHGHPVLFARRVWPELMAAHLPEGARTVIHAHAAERVSVPLPSLAADVDTPEDYRRLVEGAAE